MIRQVLLVSSLTIMWLSIYGANGYVEYHKDIVRAEEAILDSNYFSAVQIFDSLFREHDFVFARHCYMACQTAIVIKDFEHAFRFLERGIIQGLNIGCVDKDSILCQLKQDRKWKSLELKYDSLRNIYNGNINWELRFKINELYNKDQKYRDQHELHPYNILWRPFIWFKWKSVTKKIVEQELIPLIDKYGFPGEQLIGVDEQWMHHKMNEDSKSSDFAFIILIHYFSAPRPAELNSKLLAQIEQGNITPHQYASLIDFQAEWGKGKYYKGLHYNEWHVTTDATKFKEIDRNREKIGLESLESKNRKYQRGLRACKEIKEGNYTHIKLWFWCG